jgi:hypothetical protein
MLAIGAEINQQDIKNLLQNFSGNFVKKSIRSALDKSGTWGKNYLAQDVSSNYNIPNNKVKKAIAVKRTTQSKLEVSIDTKGSQLSLLNDFGATQDSIGITAQISKGAVFRVPHAFINVTHGMGPVKVTKSDKKGSYGKGGGQRFIAMRTGRNRYPMTGKPGRGPSLPMLVNRSLHRDKRNADLQNHLYKELEEQITKRAGKPQLPAEYE